MKALKNESIIYTEQIVSAIADCYRKSAEPSNAELMKLYSFTGRCICAQGEKAFVVYLAEQLSQQFPQLKGFSPRNLRRMRNFYHIYENDPSLMTKALLLGWTQNTVILECCETNEQRSFYLGLAAEQSPSKIALIKAIEANAFEAAQNMAEPCAAVCEITSDKTVDTAEAAETACWAFVPACEPSRQGDGATSDMDKDAVMVMTAIPQAEPAKCETAAAQICHQYLWWNSAHQLLFKPPTSHAEPPPPYMGIISEITYSFENMRYKARARSPNPIPMSA
ncbi:DUF1016 N-terminal domain-containing protein [Hydrogenoanaerobacterium sp.]|uniref:DUF1016 N-terminal domain-containing protein n=1 Tax=Hydrogenoanaerobacterium sp. TaxID=2953763 RepID=UPI00289AD8D8|nr:DUF1016 N-terminal domain-containing protein [Hydrogenoanaerobacterium sp.]